MFWQGKVFLVKQQGKYADKYVELYIAQSLIVQKENRGWGGANS